MIRKSKLILFTAALLCLVTVFSSCFFDKNAKFTDTYSEAYTDETPTYAQIAKIDFLGGTVVSQKCGLVVLRDGAIRTVYNSVTNMTVYSFTETLSSKVQSISLNTQLGIPYFTVVKMNTEDSVTEYTTDFYSADGTKLSGATGEITVSAMLDMLFFDGKCYRISKNGSIAYAFDQKDLSSISTDINYAAGNYYIGISSDKFTVYDKTCSPLHHYQAPSYASNIAMHVLSNGNVLIQYSCEEPENALFYTVSDGSQKFTWKTELFISESGKVKTLQTKYVFANLIGRDIISSEGWDVFENQCINPDIRNIAFGFEIKERHLDASVANAKCLEISDKGKVGKCLSGTVAAQGPSMPTPLCQKRFIISNMMGQEFFLNASGEILGEISNMSEYNEKYILTDKKVFNYNLEEVYDYGKNGMSIYQVLNSEALLFVKDEDYYLYNNDTETKLTQTGVTLQSAEDSYFILRATEGGNTTYKYYNDIGTQIFSSEVLLTPVATDADSGIILFKGSDGATTSYYRMG